MGRTSSYTLSRRSRLIPSRTMTHPVFPIRAVTALFLERQHLTRPRAHRLSPRRLTRFVEDVGGLQMDSINVLDRAHYLTVWSRFGPYDRPRLDRLVYRRRLFLEYWAHAACLVPASMLPWWRRAMLDYRRRHTGWSNWLRRNAKVLALVTEAIRSNGPMGHGEIGTRGPRRGSRGWWNWQPVQHAIHYLWMTGVLTVHSRRHFQKRFDLLERVVDGGARDGGGVGRAVPPLARGALAARDGRGDRAGPEPLPHLPAPAARGAARGGARDGGRGRGDRDRGGRPERPLARADPGPARAPARGPAPHRLGRHHPARARSTRCSGTATVSRGSGATTTGSRSTPRATKRVHGYYTLPILHHGHLIGRLDAKAHRVARWLEVRHVHFERWAGPGRDPARRLGRRSTAIGWSRSWPTRSSRSPSSSAPIGSPSAG